MKKVIFIITLFACVSCTGPVNHNATDPGGDPDRDVVVKLPTDTTKIQTP